MLLRPANLLLLDEPTNHLDLAAKEVIEEALKEYPGTVVVASHDRYFLDRIVTRTLEVRDGGIGEYLGNYTYYRQRKESEAAALAREAAGAQGSARRPRGRQGQRVAERTPGGARSAREASGRRGRVSRLESESPSLPTSREGGRPRRQCGRAGGRVQRRRHGSRR
jgi:ATP-binding cassette subfamily F protein 3